jgi:hypothetical protein
MQKRQCRAVWTSLSDPGLELIPTFAFQFLIVRLGGGKYGSFRGMTLTCRSLCSWVAALSLNPNGSMVWPRNTSTGYNPYMMSSSSCYEVG